MERTPLEVIEDGDVKIAVYEGESLYYRKYRAAVFRARLHWAQGFEGIFAEMGLPDDEPEVGDESFFSGRTDESNVPMLRSKFADFAIFSARCEVLDGKPDFTLCRAVDTAEVVRKKFMRFYASSQVDLIAKLYDAINRVDANEPDDPALAPVLSEVVEEQSPLAESGESSGSKRSSKKSKTPQL